MREALRSGKNHWKTRTRSQDFTAARRAAWKIQKVRAINRRTRGRKGKRLTSRHAWTQSQKWTTLGLGLDAVNKSSVGSATLNNVEFNFDSVLPSSSRRLGTRALIRAVKHLAAVKFPMRPAGYDPGCTPPLLAVFVDGREPSGEHVRSFRDSCLEFRTVLANDVEKLAGGGKKWGMPAG